jgi:nuclear transport factor 2 (NTF2) superfamily protein
MLNSIANDWERITHETLADIRERMKSGDVSDDEAWQVNNLDRFLLLYNLMMDRSIEENATWRNGEIVYDDREAIAQLATRLKDDAIGEESLVEDVLTYAFERGSLRFERKDDQVRWKWQNYI